MEKSKKVRATMADAENPPVTAAMMARARRIEDIPALADLSKRRPGQRGKQKAPTKEAIYIRLDREVVDHYRNSGSGWQSRLNDDLRKRLKRVSRPA